MGLKCWCRTKAQRQWTQEQLTLARVYIGRTYHIDWIPGFDKPTEVGHVALSIYKLIYILKRFSRCFDKVHPSVEFDLS
jgi:hypothetical protein